MFVLTNTYVESNSSPSPFRFVSNVSFRFVSSSRITLIDLIFFKKKQKKSDFVFWGGGKGDVNMFGYFFNFYEFKQMNK